MSKKVKILFVIPAMVQGGSETVMLHILKNISRDKFEIHFLVLQNIGELIPKIPNDIQVTIKNHSRTAFSIPSIIQFVWTLRPAIVFSTLGHLNLIIAFLKPLLPRKTVFIARESSIVSERIKDERFTQLSALLFKTVYNRFDKIICQSKSMKEDLVSNFGVKSSNISIVNNPVDLSRMPLKTKGNSCDIIRLLSVGNLRPEKGYHRLIAAVSKLNVPFIYEILGGGDQTNLLKLIEDLNLHEKVFLRGLVPEPFDYYKNADVLLIGSYYEGFPNSLLEANACGLPAVAFKAPGGHNEIIQKGINGWFAESETELAIAIESKSYLKADHQKIRHLIEEKYDIATIMAEYENLFLKLAS